MANEADGANGSDAKRMELMRRLFARVDVNGDGKLHKEEMRSLAELVGFEGTDDEWTLEYEKLCVEYGIQASSGFPERSVMQMLEDQSELGCYCTTQELQDLLSEMPGEHDAGLCLAAIMDADYGTSAQEPEPGCCSIFFAGANFRTEEEVLKSTFEKVGAVQDFALFRMLDGRSKGMGKVKFATPMQANRAIMTLNQHEVDGRRLTVKYDTRRDEEEARGVRGGSSGSRQGARRAGPAGRAPADHRAGRYVRTFAAGAGAIGGAPGGGRAVGAGGGGAVGGAWRGGGGGCGWAGAGAGGKASASRDAGGGKAALGKGSRGQGGRAARAGGGGRERQDVSSWDDGDDSWRYSQWGDPDQAGTNTVFFAGASFDTTAATLRGHFEEAGKIAQFWLFQLKDGRSRGMGVVRYHTDWEARQAIQIMHGATIDGRELLVKADDVGVLQAHEHREAGGGGGWGASGSSWDDGGGMQGWGDSWKGGKDSSSGKGWDTGGGSTGSKGYNGKGGGWKGGAPTSNRIFFAGAPFSTPSGELMEYFSGFGEVRSFTLFRLQDGRSQGMGVCTFYDSETAARALRQGIYIEGRPLYLQEDTSQSAKGGKGGEPRQALGGGGGAGGRVKGQRAAAAYQEYSSGYDYQGYGDGADWRDYEGAYPSAGGAAHGSGAGRGRGRGGGSSAGGSSGLAAGPAVSDPNKAVFFANVPFGTTESHLRRLFKSVGQIKLFDLRTTLDGRSRGMGVVEYTSEAAAERAYYELHETEVSGRPIIVDAYRPS